MGDQLMCLEITRKQITKEFRMKSDKIMKIKCLVCGDIIESKSVHDLVCCKCESCYIDGGNYYSHIGAKDFDKVVEVKDDGSEIKLNLK